jgi:hypothetical protein
MILAENLNGLWVLILLIWGAMIVPPLILFIIGFRVRKRNPSRAKVFFIMAVIYLIIGGGICANMG